jgi:ankyrin repeat protein
MRATQLVCLIGAAAALVGGCDKRKWRDRNDALRYEAAWGSVEQVQTLLARGAHVNARDKDGNTALHEAARRGRLAVAQLLIGRGANVNLRNNQGRTPVVLAMEGDTRLRLDMPDGTPVMDRRDGDRLALVELLAAVGAEPTFRLAAYLGDGGMARRLIAGGADLNAKEDGRTPLHRAVLSGCREIAELLLASGAEVNAQDAGGSTALHAAVSLSSVELTRLLLAHGADVNARNYKGGAALHVAVREGATDTVKILLTGGADVNAEAAYSRRPMTPLATALEEGWGDVAEILISAGAAVNTKERSGWTPLHAALAASYYRDVEGTIRHEYADVNLSDWHDRQQLEKEIRGKLATRMARLLIDHHADVNATDEWGVTPLHVAARAGLWSVVELLLSKGAKVNVQTIRAESGDHPEWKFLYLPSIPLAGVTPLHGAVVAGEPNVVELLIAHGAEVNAADESGRMPLHYAAWGGSVRTIELLIAKGALVDAKDKEGSTALLDALRSHNGVAAKTLMAAGAQKVTFRGWWEQKALHEAWQYHSGPELLEALLANGADPDEREGGDTLLHLLARQGQEEMAKVLLAGGASVDARSPRGATPLHYAAAVGHVGFVTLLLASGADVNARENDGDTPLHSAALRGNREMVELLLAHGADASVKNSRGRTPRDEAVRRGHADLVPLLTNAAGQGDTKARNENPGK